MKTSARRTLLFDLAVLCLATAVLILPLFRINYLDNWMSIEGTFISNARYIRDHWPHPAWHALWYCGTRFDYTYAPGTPYAAAMASMLFHVDPAHGYHIYIAFMYCLGISGIYYLVRTGTGSRGYAWVAACGGAVLSPVFAFLKQYRQDSLNWTPERLNVLVKWGEGPHMCALSFILFALAFSMLAFRGARRWTIAAASICYALVVLNDLYGALALAIFFPLLVWSQRGSAGRSRALAACRRDRPSDDRPLRMVAHAIFSAPDETESEACRAARERVVDDCGVLHRRAVRSGFLGGSDATEKPPRGRSSFPDCRCSSPLMCWGCSGLGSASSVNR